MTVKLRWLAALAIMGGFLLATLPMPAADEKKLDKTSNEQKPDKTSDEVIEDAMAAYKMAEFGRQNNVPEALVAAAGMLRSLKGYKLNPVQDSEKPKVEGEGTAADVKTKSFEEEAKELFKEALDMAALQNQEAFIKPLIQAAEARKYDTRDVIGGPRTICRTIAPKQTHSFHFNFEPNKPCVVGFKGSFPMLVTVVRGDNDHVYAAAITGQGTSRTVTGPSKTGKVPITVRVENKSKQPGTFQLFVN